MIYRSGEAAMVNRWGRTRDVPALRDLEGSLGKRGIVDAMMLAELHAMENGRPMRLPDLLHRRVADPESLKLAIFDLVKVDGKDPPEDYVWKMEEINTWMNGSKRIYPIPYKVCATGVEILTLYNQYLAMGYEGIVARAQGKIFKVKPIRSIDCVLTGINKRDKLKRNQITSLKLAVMDEKGRYIDLGDVASGIDLQLRDYLTKLLDFKVGEDPDTIYIRPFVILEVEYQETFEAEKPVREFVDGRFVTVGKVDYFNLRSPRLKRFRPDKRATTIDVPSSQLLEENCMSFTHRSSQRFKDLLEALNVLSEEVEFTANPEGLTAMQMDPRHVAMFILKMPSTAFERWDVIEEQKFTVDVTTLVKKILKNTYKDESVELSYDPDRERLDVILRSDIVRRKDVPTLENVDEEVPQPKIFFKAHARVVLRGLVKALKDFNELSEHTTITVENDSLTLSQRGDLGSQSTPFEKYGDNLIALNYEEDTKSTFTESYLEKIVRAIQPLSEVVNLDLSTDMPIKIWPELDVGSLEFYIAPCTRVGDEPAETEKEEEVTDVSAPEELPQEPEPEGPETEEPEPEIEEPASIPVPISTPALASTPNTQNTPNTIDMSVLRRLKL